MTSFHERYSDEESALVDGFCHISSSTSASCDCGRVYFTTAPTRGDFCPGVLEELIACVESQPDKYVCSSEFDTIDVVWIGGKEFVPQCVCGGVKKYIEFFEDHLDELANYCATRLKKKRENAASEARRLGMLEDAIVKEQNQ